MARKSKYAVVEEPIPAAELMYDTAGYVRRSNEDKGEATSLENQALMVQKYIEQTPSLKLCGVFSDNGQTGTNFQRPGFEEMMDAVRRGKVNCIVVKDLSRFGRDYIEAGNYIETIFPRLGIRFISIGDNFDSFDPRCKGEGVSVALKNMINAFYAKDISVKIRSAFETKRNKGEYTGGLPPFGYIKSPENRNKLIVDEEAAAIVRDIFRWRLDGLHPAAIVKRLNESGFPAPGHYFYIKDIYINKRYREPHEWISSTVRNILENPVYVGHMALGKLRAHPNCLNMNIRQPRENWVITEDTHEPIISKTDFDAVQALILASKQGHWRTGEKPGARHASAAENIFFGLIYCKDCGHVFGRRSYMTDKGKRYSYSCEYCRSHNADEPGHKRRFKENDLYNTVYAIIASHIETCAKTRRLIEKARASSPALLKQQVMEDEAHGLRTELDKFPAKIAKLYDDYCDGIISDGDYHLFRERFEVENAASTMKLKKLAAELTCFQPEFVDNNLYVTEFERFIDQRELTRDMLTTLVERIEVTSSGKVEIVFRYTDEYAPLMAFIEENGGNLHVW